MTRRSLAILLPTVALLGCAQPEGIALDRPADGRIDVFERYALVTMATTGGRPGQDSQTLLGLWNDFRVARRDWLLPQGFDPHQQGLHLRLFDTAEAAVARHQALFGHDSPHFFSHGTRTIYSFSDALPDTWGMLLHEAGHDLGTSELVAEANRIHGLIFTLALDPAVGAAVVVPETNGRLSPLLTRWMPVNGTHTDELGVYGRAVLVFLQRAREAPGSLDEALWDAARTDPALRDAELEAELARTDWGPDAPLAWYEQWAGLFDAPSFRDYLVALFRHRGQPVEQAEQLQRYLAIAAEDLRSPFGYVSLAHGAPIAQMDALLDHMARCGTYYPDLRNRLAVVLGDHYRRVALADDATPLDQRDAWARVLLAHDALPCTRDPWACPAPFFTVRRRHLEAYQGLVAAHLALGAPADALFVIGDFLDRFYPTYDLTRTDTMGTLLVLLRAGITSALALADPCRALGHAERYDLVACYHQRLPATCASDYPLDWAAEEPYRQAELEELRALCPAGAR